MTFLNIPELARQGADIQSKVEGLKQLYRSMRDRDELKDNAIAQISDQLMALSTRLQEIERRQQSAWRVTGSCLITPSVNMMFRSIPVVSHAFDSNSKINTIVLRTVLFLSYPASIMMS